MEDGIVSRVFCYFCGRGSHDGICGYCVRVPHIREHGVPVQLAEDDDPVELDDYHGECRDDV